MAEQKEVTAAQARTLDYILGTFAIFCECSMKTEYIYKRAVATSIKATIIVKHSPNRFEYHINKAGAIITAKEVTDNGLFIRYLKF